MGSFDIRQLEATLPGSHYLDSDHFRRERDAIFHREWFCAGRHEGLQNKDDYQPAELCKVVPIFRKGGSGLDWDCGISQRDMRSRVFKSGYYGPMEDLSLDIRNYVRDRLGRN